MIISAFLGLFFVLSVAGIAMADHYRVDDNSAQIHLAMLALVVLVAGLIGFGTAVVAGKCETRKQAIENNIGFYASTNGTFYFKNLNEK